MSIDAMKQALEALVWEAEGWKDVPPITRDAITALRAAIEKEKKRSKDHWCTSCKGVEPYNCKYNTRNEQK